MKNLHIFAATILLIFVWLFAYTYPTKSNADLTFVTDTLSTSRLSVAARILTIVGNLVTIDPTPSGDFNSTSSANLRAGGTGIGDAITINGIAEVISSIDTTSANKFTTVNPAPAGTAGQAIYFKSQPVHQINFHTSTSVPNGFFRVLIPAGAGNSNDGIPDPDGFDFNSLTNANASSSATANFTFATSLEGATASAGTNCTAGYHCFEYHYSGTGPSGSVITLWVGDGSKSLIAPAPKSGHALGNADAYPIIVQQFTNGDNPATATPIDSTKGQIGLIESVRVTATVDPSISFQIAGVTTGASVCGTTTNINTQTGAGAPLAVPFGVLGLNTFATAAHTLTVSTNAVNGYTVTAIENDHMGKDGGTTPYIPDATCGAAPCTISSEKNWNSASATYPGFGYAVGDAVGATPEWVVGASFAARPFPNANLLDAPARIMYSSGVSNSHTMNVCYRITVNATQAAGDYENQITYTATATF